MLNIAWKTSVSNETAYNVGFSNPKYFRKYFKEEFGITPAEFLKKYQETEAPQ